MATLTVWKFDSAGGAENALTLLERMQKEALLQVDDGAYVYWPEGGKKPPVRADLLRPVARPGGGCRHGRPVRVDGRRGHRRRVHPRGPGAGHPGTSALFVMTSNEVTDKVLEEFKPTGATLVSTNLTHEQEAKLREAFAEAD